MKNNERYWLLGIILLIIALFGSFFGFKNVDLNDEIDINIHDTYIVIPSILGIIILIALTFFIVYLIRIVWRNFKNQTANIIFIISNILLMFVVAFLIIIVNSFSEIATSLKPIQPSRDTVSHILMGIEFFLLALLVYSIIKTRINYKQTR